MLAGLLLRVHRAAHADDLPYLDWTDSLPALTTQFVPASENNRTVERTRRVDAVTRDRRRHFDPLEASCEHDSIFALAPLRTTEQYRRTMEDPTFFEDTALVNHEDAIFAAYYFKAFDARCAGRHEAVAPAWPPPSTPTDHPMPASGNFRRASTPTRGCPFSTKAAVRGASLDGLLAIELDDDQQSWRGGPGPSRRAIALAGTR